MIVSSVSTVNNNTQFTGLKTNGLKKALPLITATALLTNITLTSCDNKQDRFQKQFAQEQYEKKYPIMSKIFNQDGSPTWKTVICIILGTGIVAAFKEDKNEKNGNY